MNNKREMEDFFTGREFNERMEEVLCEIIECWMKENYFHFAVTVGNTKSKKIKIRNAE